MPLGDESFEEHVRTRTVKPPPVLYKYTTADVARLVLSTGRLRFQSPLRYNDPLDSQWDLMWPLFTPEAENYERQLVEQALRDPDAWPPDADPQFRSAMNDERSRIEALPQEQHAAAIAQFVDDMAPPREVPPEVRRQLLDMLRRLRVLCLSKTDRSLLMWSHYANQHRGVVLGFDSRTLETEFQRPFEKVEYPESPPELLDYQAWIRSTVLGTERPRLPDTRKLALTKFSDWRYEKEWRFVWINAPGTLGDYEDTPFERTALVELVFGCRADTSRSKELLGLAMALNPKVRDSRMSVHPRKFELVKAPLETAG